MKNKLLTAILFVTFICAISLFGLSACKRCEHEYGEWETVTAATCTENGTQSHTCIKCGRKKTQKINALGHEMQAAEAKAPDCENAGWDAYEQCSRCEYNTKKEIAALGHDLQFVDGKAADCENAGWDAYEQCSRCEYNTKQVIAELGHEFSDSWTTNENKHWHVCNREGCEEKSEEVAHSEVNHYCSVCGLKTSEHVYGEVTYNWSDDYDACKAVRVCANCGESAEGHMQVSKAEISSEKTQDADCVNPELTTYTATFTVEWATAQAKEKVETKAALEHDFSDSWTTNENKHWHVCNREGCEEKSEEVAHSEVNHYCSVCGLKTSEHVYGEVTYNWSDDYDACKAVRVCANCGESAEGHMQVSKAEISSEKTQDADCVNPELTTYTATFTVEWATAQAKEKVETKAALGHDLSDIAYDWASDFSGCTAHGYCSRCENTISESATIEIAENFVCSASFENKAFVPQTLDLTDLTNMTATEQENALSVIFSSQPAELALTLPKDFNSFSLINGPIKEYEDDKYIDLTLKGVSAIPEEAFYQNKKIKGVTIGEGVISIGNRAFQYCSSIESLEIGKDVKSIGENAFDSCKKLLSLTIGSGVESIATYAFYGCIELANLSIGSGVKSIGFNSFAYCPSLVSVTIPESVEKMEVNAFWNCTALTSVTIEGGSENIGDWSAFDRCTAITNITFKSVITKMNSSFFFGVTTENVTLTFAAGQKELTKSNSGYVASEAILEGGTEVSFCGCTFKEIVIAQ